MAEAIFVREVSHIKFDHKKHQLKVSFETPLIPSPPGRETSKIFIDIFGKDTAFSRFRYLSCVIPLSLAAIKIVSKHKVVCAQNLMSDPRLLYKQYKFCEKYKELTDKFKANLKLFYILFRDVSKTSKIV